MASGRKRVGTVDGKMVVHVTCIVYIYIYKYPCITIYNIDINVPNRYGTSKRQKKMYFVKSNVSPIRDDFWQPHDVYPHSDGPKIM